MTVGRESRRGMERWYWMIDMDYDDISCAVHTQLCWIRNLMGSDDGMLSFLNVV